MAHRVCPWWLGYVLVNPIRRLLQKPEDVVGPHVREGARVLDVGPGMGFFSLPMARLVGPRGRVICVDLQERMLAALLRRAARAGLGDRIETRCCDADSLGIADLEGQVDFALAFAMVHEVPEPARLLTEISQALAPGSRLLLAEPSGHVSSETLQSEIEAAAAAGLSLVDRPVIRGSRTALLTRAG